MRILAIIAVICGVALAGGAAFYAQKLFEAQANLNNAGTQTVKLLAAKEPLAADSVLSIDQLQWVDWPRWSVPPGTFRSPEEIFGKDGTDRRYVMNTIQPGELILHARLSPPNQASSIRVLLELGEKAISFPINAVSGVSGFVAPGDHVDILHTYPIDGTIMSLVLLENVRVLAIDQAKNVNATSPRVGSTATVAVSTRNAQILTLAMQNGSLSLLLRGAESSDGVENGPMDLDDLNGPRAPDADPGKTIKRRRGNEIDFVPVE